MNIDRRCFLSLGIGAAAGTAISPLPWKVIDDASIWTQMWPWTPVPEDGRVTYSNSACLLCPAGCGLSVRKVNDRVVKVEGAKKNPVNTGSVCILGLTAPQLLYGPNRITGPLKRKGKRGDGTFEPISWQEAMAEFTGKLASLRAENKAHTLACISGSGSGTVAELIKRFLTVFGSPNFMHMPSMGDMYGQTLKLMHGVDAAAGIDLENADYVLSFSSGIIEGWGSPVRMFKANSRIKAKHGKTVQIDTRLSSSAAKADQWVPITPGAEAVLALGLCYVIIDKGKFDPLMVNTYSTGFDAFKRFVMAGFSPEKVADQTGVGPGVIVALADAFADAKRAVAVCGRGQGDTPGALAEYVAVHALNALVGNINRRGGVWAVPRPDYIRWRQPNLDNIARKGLARKRIDGAGNGMMADSLPNRLPEVLADGDGDGIEILMVSGANPLYTLRDGAAFEKAMEKVGFIVNFASDMDETAMYSDLILPNHAFLERYEDAAGAGMLNKPYISLARPVVKPLHNTRHTGDVIIQAAMMLKGAVAAAFAWPSYEACLKQTLGSKWMTLEKNGFWMASGFTPPDWPGAFRTADRRFNFSTPVLTKNPVSTDPEGDSANYPLVLIPYDSMRLSNDAVVNPPFMTKTVSDAILKGKDILVEINPKTADEFGLANGDRATVKTPKGTARVRVHLTRGIGPNLIAMAKGLGHTAGDGTISGKGVNVNRLMGAVSDPVTGLDAAWGIRAALAKS